MSERRVGRIEEEIKKIISDIIQNDLKNPNIKGIISITSVSISNDLKYANVYVSIFDKKSEDATLPTEIIKILNKSKGFIRRELASRITLRYTPEITFKEDSSISYGAHIDEILKEISPKDEE